LIELFITFTNRRHLKILSNRFKLFIILYET
jgi:hypothetical protein